MPDAVCTTGGFKEPLTIAVLGVKAALVSCHREERVRFQASGQAPAIQ